jgi:murein DD-endopeptidase MepM/ murein hydrolase activator NlpD
MTKRWAGLLTLLLFAVIVSLFNRYYQPDLSSTALGRDSVGNFALQIREPNVLYGMTVDNYLVIQDKIKRNERLGDILEAYNVPAKLIHEVSQLSRSIFDVRKVAPDKKYTLICNSDSMKTAKALVYEPNPIDYIVFHFDDSLSIDVCQREVKVVEKTISGIIESSLAQTIDETGISYELTNKFVDIFAWQVDFQRLQKGDSFKLIYEETQVEGKTISINKITGIYFQHFNHEYYAVPFDQGSGVEFFDGEGKSLRKALLKYPIEFTRISSRYTMNRFHPVQKRWKAHLGTDFAAPVGTPIRSVGDGYVEEAQYKSNNGNYVKIKHNGTYTTQYLHMSRIASGIHAGMRVRQGETIGYVGSTGLATGPHLCYRFWRNGVQVDALGIELPASEPIKKEFAESFNVKKAELIQRLNTIALPNETQEQLASIK